MNRAGSLENPFARLAEVSGAADAAACARDAQALFVDPGALPENSFDAAVCVKKHLVRRGFRDDPQTFTLPGMLACRGGNCLGLTLLVGAALIDQGHAVDFVIRLDPFDDVHAAGEEHFAKLSHPDLGVHEDSRLPEASDRTARFRFVPVEHASLVLRDREGNERAFEATSLLPGDEDDSGWAPEAESVRRIGFWELTSTVRSERAKVLLGDLHYNSGARKILQRAVRLSLRAVREWPSNREAWTEVWQAAGALAAEGQRRFGSIAARAAQRYAEVGGDDSLFWFTRYRMTGEEASLERALSRLPSYAEAYFEFHVGRPLARGGAPGAMGEVRRHLAIAAWMVAESEILDLERFYREKSEHVARAFSVGELEEVLGSFLVSFAPAIAGDPGNQG